MTNYDNNIKIFILLLLMTSVYNYNYTFNSLGSISAIVLLNFITMPLIDKASVLIMHLGSLFGIMFISHQYFSYFRNSIVSSNEITLKPN